MGHISDFDKKVEQTSENNNNGGPINFSIAQKIEGTTGSTCDTFITTYHDSRVFIKKLKAKFSEKVLYRKALEKEFDLGYRLKHTSLPIYKEFHGDYIIMEYIEGETLEELIKKKDTWLQKDGNVRKILKQLIEVVDYLHQNGISHCDVKADNIIITKGHRNVVLLDLDKCFTSSKDNTPGASSLYNVASNRTGHPDVDFHGIGMLIKKLADNIPNFPIKRFTDFITLCYKEDIDAESLLDWLQKTQSSNKRISKKSVLASLTSLLPFLILILILAGLAVFLILNDNKKEPEPSYMPTEPPLLEPPTESVIKEETIPDNISETELEDISEKNTTKIIDERNYIKEIEEGMKVRMAPVNNILQETNQVLLNSDSVPDKELINLNYKIMTIHSSVLQDSYNYFEHEYPSVNPVDIQLAVVKSSSFQKVSKEIGETTKKIADIMVSRHPESYEDSY